MTERESSRLRHRATLTRGALLLTAVLLGLALVAASLANYRESREAYETLNRGQIEILDNAVRLALLRPGVELTEEVLDSVVEAHSGAGLRYLALIELDGSVLIDGGETDSPITIPASFFQEAQASGIVMVPLEHRIRGFIPRSPIFQFFAFRPPALDSIAVAGTDGPGGTVGQSGAEASGSGQRFSFGPPQDFPDSLLPDGAPGNEPDRADEDSRGDDRRQGGRFGGGRGAGMAFASPFGHTLIEFEPVVAMQLLSQARRSLALGSVMAAVLTLAAVVLWRQHARYEAARATFEQQRRLSQLGEMSAVLAHEIRNPLASLKGNAQLLAERLPADSRDRAKAERVVTEATRLETLTGDLLEFARSGPIDRKATSPFDLAVDAVNEVAPDGIIVDAVGAPTRWSLDATRLRHALVNILQNAVQASPDRPPRLSVRRSGSSLVFEVRDFGPGIPAGAESQLFEPFFTTKTNGTGLGLAVARRAAEGHGGTIEAHNHPDGGAVFEIRIPEA